MNLDHLPLKWEYVLYLLGNVRILSHPKRLIYSSLPSFLFFFFLSPSLCPHPPLSFFLSFFLLSVRRKIWFPAVNSGDFQTSIVMKVSPTIKGNDSVFLFLFSALMASWRFRQVKCCMVLGWMGGKLSLGSESGHCFESRPSSYHYPLAWIVFKQTVIDLIYFPNGCFLLSLRIFNVQNT